MDIKKALPRGQLRAIIRSFEQRTAELGNSVLARPLAVRPHQVRIIHLADSNRVRIPAANCTRSLRQDLSVHRVVDKPTPTVRVSSRFSPSCSNPHACTDWSGSIWRLWSITIPWLPTSQRVNAE